MQLGAAVVVFAASLPHAIVRHPVGSFHTEHQVLDEGNLHTENTAIKQGMGDWEWMEAAAYPYKVSWTCTHTLIDPGLQVANTSILRNTTRQHII